MKTYINHFVMMSFLSITLPTFAVSNIPFVNTAQPSQVSERLSRSNELFVARASQVQIGEVKEQAPFVDANKITFTLRQLIITGNTVIPTHQLQALYQDKLGKEISLADLQTIAHAITVMYRDRGYVLSQAFIPPQKIQSGVVKIQIVEGYIENVLVEGTVTRGTDELLSEYGAHIAMDQPIHITTLERYALLANDLPGVSVQSVITPSKTTRGAADITFVVKETRFYGEAQVDNQGADILDREELSVAGFVNDLLPGSKTGLRAVTSADFSSMQFYEFSHEQPLGTRGLLFRFFANYTRTNPDFAAVGQPLLDNDGENLAIINQLIYPVIRSRHQNLFINGAFDINNNSTDFFQQNLFNDQVRSLRLGFTYDLSDSLNGINLLSFQVSQGLNILGATESGSEDLSRINGRSDYTKLNFDLSRLQVLPLHFSLYAALASQYAFEALLASEQFSFGGPIFGRGYDPSELLGDSGIDGKVELRYNFMPNRFYISYLQPFIFYDVGFVSNRDKINQIGSVDASSTGGGLRINFVDYLRGEVLYGQPLTSLAVNNFNTAGRVLFVVNLYS